MNLYRMITNSPAVRHSVALGAMLAAIAAHEPARAMMRPPITDPGGSYGGPSPCTYGGSKTFGVGSASTIRGEFNAKGSIYQSSTQQQANAQASIRGCLIGDCVKLALASITQSSWTPGQALLQVAGKTLLTQSLGRSGAISYAPVALKIPLSGSIPIIPGVLSATLSASFGAGASMGMSYSANAAPPSAKASGNAKAYGYGSGGVGVELLDGIVGKASCNATLTLPSPSIAANLDASVCRATPNPALTASIDPWTLKATVKYAVGCVPWVGCLYSGSDPIANYSGTASSYGLM